MIPFPVKRKKTTEGSGVTLAFRLSVQFCSSRSFVSFPSAPLSSSSPLVAAPSTSSSSLSLSLSSQLSGAKISISSSSSSFLIVTLEEREERREKRERKSVTMTVAMDAERTASAKEQGEGQKGAEGGAAMVSAVARKDEGNARFTSGDYERAKDAYKKVNRFRKERERVLYVFHSFLLSSSSLFE